MVISADGNRLYVAVRDFNEDEDCVYSFRLEADGKATLLAATPVGDIPWKLGLSPDDRILLVSETGDKKLSAYRIEPDGRLLPAESISWGISARDMVISP
ncbi:MAG: beta-propeller fold lactonase family protein [Planctomycetales bacterium]|nr:beta-propeller fold lactonase family protein [Planctomycetales bacterium]